MKTTMLLATLLCASALSHAADLQSKLIQIYQERIGKNGKPVAATINAGLVNMDEVLDEPGSNCQQFIGPIKVEGVQFSPSGAVLQSFRFTDPKGSQWAVPTNIEKLGSADRSHANSFIRVGKQYFAHVQVCGSGGFASLVNLYDSSITLHP